MAEEVYWVQVAYHRKPVEAPKVESAPAEAVAPVPNAKIRPMSPEQEAMELKRQRETDNPRVRKIFDLLDAPSKKQPLPEGVRLNQGDLVAPGLILEERPFPDWFHQLMDANGWEYNKGNSSFMLAVEGKQKAEAWYCWLMEIFRREKEYATAHKLPALSDNIGVYIREDHTFLWQDELTKFFS